MMVEDHFYPFIIKSNCLCYTLAIDLQTCDSQTAAFFIISGVKLSIQC